MNLLGKELSSVAVLLVALCAFVKQGLAIRCYMCNSAPTRNGQRCDSLEGDVSVFVQNCDHLPEVRHNLTRYSVCRKMHQKIFDPKGNHEIRIVRQCGTEIEVGCTWQTRPNTLHVKTCHCITDLCNTAVRPAHQRHLTGITFLAALISWIFGLSYHTA